MRGGSDRLPLLSFAAMTWQEVLLGTAIGSIAGILSGLTGVGGGIVLIPLMTYLLGYNQHTAQGTALLVFSLPVALGGAYTYYRQKRADIGAALFMSAAILLTGFFVAKSVQHLQSDLLSRIFSGFLVVVGTYLLLRRRFMRTSVKENPLIPLPVKAIRSLIVGFISGILSGLTGLGGGVVKVPLMRWILRFDQHMAQGTSLVSHSIPVLIGSMIPYYQAGHVKVLPALAIAAGQFAASTFAGAWAQRVRGRHLEVIFAILLLILGILGFLKRTSGH
jgi:uncharacterized membrane protein YfcA